MSAAVLVAILGTGGFSAILAAVITALASKRKIGAEATQIITDAASSVVKSIDAQLARAERERVADQAKHERQMNHMAEAHILERNEWRKVLQLHVSWDALAIARLSETGVTMPPPPPMTPARRFVGEDGFPISAVD